MRSLQGRLKMCKERGSLTEEDEQGVQSPFRTFKSMFPSTPLEKHQPLDILITTPSSDPRAVIVRDLGAIQNNWIARELVLAYFEGQGLSQKVSFQFIKCFARSSMLQLKQSVCQRLAEI